MNAKQKKYLIYGGAAVGVGIAGFLVYNFLIKPKIAFNPNVQIANASMNGGSGTPVNTQQQQYIAPASSFPLRNGSNGAMVKALQTALLTIYGKDALGGTTADGGFGAKTLAAVQKYLGLASGEVSESNFNIVVNASKSGAQRDMQDSVRTGIPSAIITVQYGFTTGGSNILTATGNTPIKYY